MPTSRSSTSGSPTRKTAMPCGAYNLIVRTRDGGKTWESWFDRTDNPKFFNLYAIRPVAGELFIAGEGGLVLKLDGTAQRFRGLTVPYNGSFFGVTDAGSAVVVFGLRGNVYRSDDRGATWSEGRRRTAGVGRRRNTHRGGDHAARRCRRPCRGHIRWRPYVRQGGAFGDDAAHWNRRCGRRQACSRRAARCRGFDDDSALTRAHPQGRLTWPRSRSKPNRCRWSAISRTSTASRATGSNGWCSTTGWRW